MCFVCVSVAFVLCIVVFYYCVIFHVVFYCVCVCCVLLGLLFCSVYCLLSYYGVVVVFCCATTKMNGHLCLSSSNILSISTCSCKIPSSCVIISISSWGVPIIISYKENINSFIHNFVYEGNVNCRV